MLPWILGLGALYYFTKPRQNAAERAAEAGGSGDAAAEVVAGAEGGELPGDRDRTPPSEEVL